jgi:hypothetical protein
VGRGASEVLPLPDVPLAVPAMGWRGRFVKDLCLLAKQLLEQRKLHLYEAFVDATFASVKKGALA